MIRLPQDAAAAHPGHRQRPVVHVGEEHRHDIPAEVLQHEAPVRERVRRVPPAIDPGQRDRPVVLVEYPPHDPAAKLT